ncbi:MAG: Hsp20/alpha crystallin family protein [Oligoflexia bacterium]|nr:Hsp20/alpha crystallin family protein [Oligoflexia bacterium]
MNTKELEVKDKKELEITSEKTYSCKVYVPDTDIYENDKEIILAVDIPGVNKNDVKIQLENSILSIDAKVRPQDYDKLRPLYSEYNVGHFYREFRMGEMIEKDKIDASVKNGVLKLTLPKIEKLKPKQIAVR